MTDKAARGVSLQHSKHKTAHNSTKQHSTAQPTATAELRPCIQEHMPTNYCGESTAATILRSRAPAVPAVRASNQVR